MSTEFTALERIVAQRIFGVEVVTNPFVPKDFIALGTQIHGDIHAALLTGVTPMGKTETGRMTTALRLGFCIEIPCVGFAVQGGRRCVSYPRGLSPENDSECIFETHDEAVKELEKLAYNPGFAGMRIRKVRRATRREPGAWVTQKEELGTKPLNGWNDTYVVEIDTMVGTFYLGKHGGGVGNVNAPEDLRNPELCYRSLVDIEAAFTKRRARPLVGRDDPYPRHRIYRVVSEQAPATVETTFEYEEID